MAKVKFTSIVSEIRGKVRGDVFKGYRQGFSLQHKANPPKSNTARQQLSRSSLVYLIGFYNTLSEIEKTAWTVYGAVLVPPMTGQNAFVRLNLSIMLAPDCGYSLNREPPLAPTVELPPEEIIYWKNFDDTHQIFSTAIGQELNSVQLWKAFLPGYSMRGRERWKYVCTRPYSNPKIIIDNPFELSIPCVFRARTLAPSGKTSVFSTRQSVVQRTLNYLDRCEAVHADFDGVYESINLTTDCIEGLKSYIMHFLESIDPTISFGYTFDPPIDLSACKTLNYLMKAAGPIPFGPTEELRITSRPNGETYAYVLPWTLIANAWTYVSHDLSAYPDIPGGFQWDSIVGIVWTSVNGLIPNGDAWNDINLDHVHLDL